MATNISTNDLKQRILQQFSAIAPDIDPATIDPDLELRDQFDFDSMDRLHFATGISKEFTIEIPEKDYPQLVSLQKACDYVAKRLATT
jgi:acyl carrier protein